LTGTGTLRSTGNWLNSLTIQSGTTSITSGAAVLTYTFINQATIDIPSTATLKIMDTYTNNGIITGSGSIEIDVITSHTFTLGTANNASLSFILQSWAASQTVSLNGNLSIGGTFEVSSQHATNTMTLSHDSNYQLQVAGLTTLGTNGVMTQGTGTWTLTGGLTINGTGALFTQAGAVSTAGNFALTSGTFTASAGIFTFNKTSLQTITGAPVFATIATSGSGTKVEGSFSATTVTTVAGTYIIATTWAGTANDYRIYVHTGESLNKSTITTDFSSSSNVTLKRGSFACNETAAANSIVIDSGTTFTNNAGITLTCCSITNNGTFINNGIISCGISYPSYIIDVTNMIDNAHMIDATNWRRNILL
jgi:hypothetical protein